MGLFSIFGGSKSPAYPTDKIEWGKGEKLTFTFFAHASLAITLGERHIYIDPVSDNARYSTLPKADAVLITHHHYDHLDRAAIDDITTRNSLIICDKTSAESFDGEAVVMTPGAKAKPFDDVLIEAVAAYNTSEGHTDFHPRSREDCGYVISIENGPKIYIAGDTEPTEEMLSLKDIDIAFLPVNQPYTMTVEQAAEVIKTLQPKVFYPYHYGQVEEKTDIEKLKALVADYTEIRVFPME